ncbi:MAG: IS3 family transposase, partial [Prevotellaceae bacterium]|nr:IS3 family transposase [Prevotellaceae bacterium]
YRSGVIKKKHRVTAIGRCSRARGHSISRLCGYFKISRSGYYKRNKQKVTQSMERQMVIEMIVQARRLQPRIGGRKLYHILGGQIHSLSPGLGRDKFFGLLRSAGLLVSRKRSYTRTTDSYHRFHRYGNLLKDLAVTSPNKVLVTDITYIRTRGGFSYLSLLTDYYSRKIVGWHLSGSLEIEGSICALQMALSGCSDTQGLIHHSDRGIQYCSDPYTGLLRSRGVRISMTQENHCYENALAERVNGILKDEYLLDATFRDHQHARRACAEAIRLYNTRRPHWALGLKTPEEVHRAA